MKLNEQEINDLEYAIYGKRELIDLLLGKGLNDYMNADEDTVKGFFKALIPHLIEYSILEYQERKKIASKYNLSYDFLYRDGEVFSLGNPPFIDIKG